METLTELIARKEELEKKHLAIAKFGQFNPEAQKILAEYFLILAKIDQIKGNQ